MQHSFQIEGFGIRIRPVRMEDAAFIVWLRNLDCAKGNVGDSATSVAAQRLWLAAYGQREGDFYFLIETSAGIPLGTIGIYDMSGQVADIGRFIMRPGLRAAVPSVYLAFELAFGVLRLTSLRGTVVASNAAARTFYDSLGFRQLEIATAAQVIGGRPVDIVHLRQTADDWAAARARLLAPARWSEAKTREWEQRQLANPQAHPWQ